MFKRVEIDRPPAGRDVAVPPAPAAPPFVTAQPVHVTETGLRAHMDHDVINIGKSVVIKGELNGSEDLTIEGSVDGKIELRDHVLTIGSHGKIKAEVFAKVVVVVGEVVGNITASEKVEIRDNGSVDGNIVSPRVAIAEGSHFRGSVDMQKKAVPASAQPPKADVKTDAKAAPLAAALPGTGGPQLVGAK
jgi:cytoskeletal protein CcmA (bactofilin family)